MELERIKMNMREKRIDQQLSNLHSEVNKMNADMYKISEDVNGIVHSIQKNALKAQKKEKRFSIVFKVTLISFVIGSLMTGGYLLKPLFETNQVIQKGTHTPIVEEKIKEEKMVNGVNVLGWEFLEKDNDPGKILDKVSFTKIVNGNKIILESKEAKGDFDLLIKMYAKDNKSILASGINGDTPKRKSFFYSFNGETKHVYKYHFFMDYIAFDADFYIGFNGEKLEKATEKKVEEMYNKRHDKIEVYTKNEKTDKDETLEFTNLGINADNYKTIMYNIMKNNKDYESFKEKYRFKMNE